MTAIPKKMRAIQIQEQGGLDVIQEREIDVPKPGSGEVLYKVEWAGNNFIDTYQRGGIYKLPMPYVLGNESSGTVVALGPDITEKDGIKVGDKVVAYTSGGSFAEYCVNKAAKTAVLPAGITTRQAATITLSGLTALTFVKEAYEVKKGDFILVQAAAGALGLLLCQLATFEGAHVIGTTSTKEKAELAKKAGAKDVILYSDKSLNVAEEVYKITGGEGIDRGVHAVFDGVGKDTFETDFEIVRRKGMIVSCGNASGPVAPFPPLKLGPKNLKICRPTLNQYVYTNEEFKAYSSELFKIFQEGGIKLDVYAEYPLSKEGITKAQEDITSRKTTGKLLIKVAE